jgi:hypothetical protein
MKHFWRIPINAMDNLGRIRFDLPSSVATTTPQPFGPFHHIYKKHKNLLYFVYVADL